MPRSGITLLDSKVSSKIAAGEVIDRPSSVLRELIDNAIDASSSEIYCNISGGGASILEVVDNGFGMSRQDLELACLRHSTSKIHTEEDLFRIQSLGFRGEALYSISAVSQLEILSRTEDSPLGYRLSIEGGEKQRIDEVGSKFGTRVAIRELFFNIPARKRFIKSIRGETNSCRRVFVEKAIAHPHINFQFSVDQKPVLLLPPKYLEQKNEKSADFRARIAEIYPEQCRPELLHNIEATGLGFRFQAVIGLPPLHRADKRFIQIFCNRRRIYDYSLVHAVEYAFSSILPGSRYPVAFVFLSIDPAEVDINIHPAKKEVRFRNPDPIHRRIREAIQQFIEFYTRRSLGRPSTDIRIPYRQLSNKQLSAKQFSTKPQATRKNYSQGFNNTAEVWRAAENPSLYQSQRSELPAYKYYGQLFNLFFLVEVDDKLLIIDMHAAHERILFDRYSAQKASIKLLIPTVISPNGNEGQLRSLSPELNTMGFESRINNKGELVVSSIPIAMQNKEHLLKDMLKEVSKDISDLKTALYAGLACRSAIKDGDIIDESSAHAIIKESFNLPVQRCPHGRPIWIQLSKTELFQLIGRIL